MKKALTTQELVNIYPPWAKVRTDEQSVGYQLLNTFGSQLDQMDQYVEKMKYNQYLATANIDEVDLAFKVVLPVDFEFEHSTLDPTSPTPLEPEVEGLVIDDTMSGYVTVTLADDNDLDHFWYKANPSRVTVEAIADDEESVLLSQEAQTFPWSGVVEHHLTENQDGGRVWVQVTGGVQFVTTNERGEVDRGEVTLRGVTRKGTEETETLIFAWDEKRASLKEWKRLTSIDVFNMESGVNVEIRSGDFDEPPYWDFWNLRYSEDRTKIDEFWQLDPAADTDFTALARVGFISDEWQQLVLGFSEKESKERWDLLDENWSPVSGVDLAVQPFTDRAWVVTSEGDLFCYSLEEETISGVQKLAPRVQGSDIEIEVENRHILLGEDIVFTPWHARAVQEIRRYRVWYQDPSGAKYGILNGSPVSFSSNFWAYGGQLKRSITDTIVLTSDQRGEYLLVVEAEMVDDSSHVDRTVVLVQSKLPLSSLSLDGLVTGTILGIDFDSDQRLWVRTSNGYYKLEFHYDTMLIDYRRKILYFRENYADVQVTV